MNLLRFTVLLLLASLAVAPARAQTYILATPDVALNSDGWAFGSGELAEFRTAIGNPVNFGPGGTVPVSISVTELSSSTLTASSLAAVNGFMVPWWNNSQSAAFQTTVLNAFFGGMDMWLLEDDQSHNGIGTALGIVSSQAAGTVSNGTAPFFSGPFGTATNTTTYGNFDQFDAATILALHGTIIGTNTSGQVTAAYWAKGAFAPGSGALVLFGDVDMISNAAYSNVYSPTLTANGILALNTVDALVQAVPEPGTYALMGLGLVALLVRRRRV